jgi:uncharacterized membrane protein YgdD (TMEM256/DUF423 family)
MNRGNTMRQYLFRFWIAAGAVAGLLGVAMAAFTAHAAVSPVAREMLRSAVEMQMWHALALIGVGLWARTGSVLAEWAGAAFVLGIIGFCGGVYSLALADLRLPMVAPTGGTLLMVGWALLGLSVVRIRR